MHIQLLHLWVKELGEDNNAIKVYPSPTPTEDLPSQDGIICPERLFHKYFNLLVELVDEKLSLELKINAINSAHVIIVSLENGLITQPG